MGSVMRSPRRRPPIKRVTFTNQAGDNVVALRNIFLRGITLAHEEREKPGDRGAGVPLKEDW